MSKGQRGNKEAKKPKRAPAPSPPQVAAGLTTAQPSLVSAKLKK